VLSLRRPDDPFAEEFVRAAEHYIELPNRPSEILERIRNLGLDVLFFNDVGMDPMTYSLAFSRSAPIQCVTWGHPVTTGSPEMDYFISSDRLEISTAQDHYCEELVRLPELAVYYPKPVLPTDVPNRQYFGFSAQDHLYGCPQTLFKFHPEFDGVLSEIVLRDPRGHLVLIEGRHPSWTASLRRRLERSLGKKNIERVHFLPRLSWQEFMGVTQFVDVLLDPLHFGGGNTTYEALALGKPVVSLPGDFLRSRITRALYERMGFNECLVQSNDQYIELALRIGSDREYSRFISSSMLELNHSLFDDLSGIRQLEDFWEHAVRLKFETR